MHTHPSAPETGRRLLNDQREKVDPQRRDLAGPAQDLPFIVLLNGRRDIDPWSWAATLFDDYKLGRMTGARLRQIFFVAVCIGREDMLYLKRPVLDRNCLCAIGSDSWRARTGVSIH